MTMTATYHYSESYPPIPNPDDYLSTLLRSFNKYLNCKKLAPVSIVNYLADVKKFLRWLNKPQISTGDFTEYIHYLLSIKTPVSTLRRCRSSLKMFGCFLKAENIMLENPILLMQNINLTLESAKVSDIKNVIDEFGRMLTAQNLSRATVVNYLSDLKQFAEWLDKKNNRS